MAPRDPSRPKAADLDDAEVLRAVDQAAGKDEYPGDYFPGIPGKVFMAKVAKLHGRGLVTVHHEGKTARYIVTQKGREALSA